MGGEEWLRKQVQLFDLAAFEEGIVAAARPSVRLVADITAEETILEGASRLGGRPDLPPGAEWPDRDGRPLSFLAQIDLAAVVEHAPAGVLPTSGVLWFFYDALEQPWGFPEDKGGWRVLFAPAPTGVVRTSTPGNAPAFGACALRPFRELTIPFTRTVAARSLGLDHREFSRYYDMLSDYETGMGPPVERGGDRHRLLGHADAIHGDMTRQIEYALHDRSLDDESPAIELAARSWRLLMQIGSQENAGMNWGGNVGRLFFWIRAQDLAMRRFEDVALQLQC